MKATIEVELMPFGTPNYVRAKKIGEDEKLDDTTIHLRELSAETLYKMCEAFTDDVFKKAGKQKPPTAA